MISQDIERLRSIKTFPSLVKYLRDELDWPIESEDFDELTFEYEPDELGIDAKTAVKIKEIKQLRPLSSKQPWGIFFINFEPKQLPIVVLRRILRSLVIKKRASASKSHQAAWQLHDLLFISSYGETEHREITFAHFSEPTDRLFGDLPTLRVLGWDDDDTKLKVDHVVRTLAEKMRWPENEDETEIWRKKWSDAFELRPREVISTSKDLAVHLADLAKSIRQRANLILHVESERGPLRMLHKAFQTALIHDLSEDDFADMYAQTIAYGLLAARVSRPAGVIADNLADMIPTNPFLKDLLGTFLTVGGRKGKIDFDELGIQEVVDLLNNPDTHIEAVMRDFGKKTMQEDPVIHFYELFLNEYDKKKKIQRGVFYTPQPVVSYIVRSVHELLKTEFGLEDGLASTITWGEMHKINPEIKIPEGLSPNEPFVQILDPATGTATFLVEVIDVVYKRMTEKWQKEGHMALEFTRLWNRYVPKHLLPRLYGFELMMAPYAIAHMKIGLKLAETGYHFGSDERAHIYLTNSLEPPSDVVEQPIFKEWAPALAHEAKAVNDVKRNKRFTAIIGNPPYANFGQLNKNSFILELLEDYKRGLDEKKINIDDDFIKFVRFSQHLIDNTGIGSLGMITNNVFIDGITHRQMRRSLMDGFNEIYIYNLHGNLRKGEKCPDGSKDENIFDIMVGVSINIFSKSPKKKNKTIVKYFDLWGLCEQKLATLCKEDIGKTTWQMVNIEDFNNKFRMTPWGKNFGSDLNLFVQRGAEKVFEYGDFCGVTNIFTHYNSGIISRNDDVTIHFSEVEIKSIVEDITKLKLDELRRKYCIKDGANWKLYDAKKDIIENKSRNIISPITYRPLDRRFTLFTCKSSGFLNRPIFDTMKHLTKDNLALITTRQQSLEGFRHVLCSNTIVDIHSISDQNYVFPLYLYSESLQFHPLDKKNRIPNISNDFIKLISNKIGLDFIRDGHGDRIKTFGPDDIFWYTYAIFHSLTFRECYSELLKLDFPRMPLTTSLNLFKTLAELGGKLVSLHLMESPRLNKFITKFYGTDRLLTKVGEKGKTLADVQNGKGSLYINGTSYFDGIPQNVWEFHIGSYQVCHKWLDDRKKAGRSLSDEDIEHYQKIIVSINETIKIMKEIDEVINQYGGWPDAFLSKEEKAKSEYDVQPQPVPKAAEEISGYSKQKVSTTRTKLIPLKKDWGTWFALSQWAQETMRINSYWVDFAHEIGKNLKEGKPLTDKQKEDISKCWQQAIKKGFKPKNE